ncbi:hypothetical protein GOP47_0001212 [Adiantum capillus-veneris]|uniref:Pentatricopeptide repeat-containing protein n=1 Tax=Adiantum capillus-veneris TaxID=13818 RepID=A0A9D4ZRH4_ADICA|nr:hypothetical protein GOP47_0001212 [Adiantum capillus-veneris]
MPPLLSLEDCARLLHGCKQEGSTRHALRLCACMLDNGLFAHPLVGGNHLLSLLVEMDCLVPAHLLFNRLPHRDENSWNMLISGYSRCGSPEQLLSLYKQMPEDQFFGICGSAFVALLKACTELKDVETGSKLHIHIATMGLHERDVFVGSTLIDMYAKCGSILKAEEAFDKLLVRNIVSWNALLTGYVEHCLGMEAIDHFEQMQHAGVYPDAVTMICTLKACAINEARSRGQELHMEISSRGLDRELRVGSALVDMYTKCGLLADAQNAFDRMPIQDVVVWTALITGYTDVGESREAINCYKRMQAEHILPNTVTYACALKACISIKAIEQGQDIHSDIERTGGKDLIISNALMNFYANSHLLAEATHVFNKLLSRDQVSWNTLIAAFIQWGHPGEALFYFCLMENECVSPDAVTVMLGLKACANLSCLDEGQSIHAEITKRGFDLELFVSSALIDCYAKHGFLREAQDVFEKLPSVDVIAWTTLVVGYAEHGLGEETLDCLECMRQGGSSPASATLESCLKACGSLGALGIGYNIHLDIAKRGWEQEVTVGSSLVDCYAKCGSMPEAQAVFNKVSARNVITWTALIAGYAQAGGMQDVVRVIEMMMVEGVEPNAVTTTSVLSACSRAGTVDVGQALFEEISTRGCIFFEHCTCMLELLSRAGQFQTAILLTMIMPFHPRRVAWRTILEAWQKTG